MATVAGITTPTQPTIARKVFRAVLDDAAGMLGKIDDRILFIADDTNEMVWIEPEHVNFLVVLGEIGLSDSQLAQDTLAGGYAAVACSREMGVA